MHTDLQTKDLNGSGHNARLNTLPDSCPSCHRAVHPKLVDMRVTLDTNAAQVVFQCVYHPCQKLFLATYVLASQNAGQLRYEYRFSAPILPTHHAFPEVIQAVSPTFCVIYSQVEHAESQQLDQLVGIGLRKALEFLVKDFAQSEHPDSSEAIQKSLLGPCIDKYLNDQNIKQCAKRAAWLGNDETHYVRKWESKDIQDLKLLVRLTVNWLENNLLTKKYIADMPPEA